MLIKETAIKHLLTYPVSKNASRILLYLIDPKRHNFFVPVDLPARIALELGCYEAFKYHMGKLGIFWESQGKIDWLGGLQQFFNLPAAKRQRMEVPLTTGLRIPFEGTCFLLAKINFIKSLIASDNEELLLDAIQAKLFNPCDFTDEYDNTMLHLLAERGRLETLLALKKQYALPLTKNIDNATPLHFLMKSGEYQVIKEAMYSHSLEESLVAWHHDGFAQGADIYGNPYAFYLAQSGNFACLKKMIDKKFINPLLITESGRTLWHALAYSGDVAAIKEAKRYLRMQLALDLNAIVDNYGNTVWSDLVRSNVRNFYRLAAAREFNLDEVLRNSSIFYAAAISGHADDLWEDHKKIVMQVVPYALLGGWHGGIALDVNFRDIRTVTLHEYKNEIIDSRDSPFFRILSNLLSRDAVVLVEQSSLAAQDPTVCQQTRVSQEVNCEPDKNDICKDIFAACNEVLYCDFSTLFGLGFNDLPPEVCCLILKNLPINEVLIMRLVSRLFNALMHERMKIEGSETLAAFVDFFDIKKDRIDPFSVYKEIAAIVKSKRLDHRWHSTLSGLLSETNFVILARNFPLKIIPFPQEYSASYFRALFVKRSTSNRKEIIKIILQEDEWRATAACQVGQKNKYLFLPFGIVEDLTWEELELYITSIDIKYIIGQVISQDFQLMKRYPNFPWVQKIFAQFLKHRNLYYQDPETVTRFLMKVVEDNPSSLLIIYQEIYLEQYSHDLVRSLLNIIPLTAILQLREQVASDGRFSARELSRYLCAFTDPALDKIHDKRNPTFWGGTPVNSQGPLEVIEDFQKEMDDLLERPLYLAVSCLERVGLLRFKASPSLTHQAAKHPNSNPQCDDESSVRLGSQ